MNAPAKPKTQTAVVLENHLERLKRDVSENLERKMASSSELPDLFEAFGLERDLAQSPDAESLLALRVGLNALPEVIEAVLGVGLNQGMLDGHAAVEKHTIVVHKTSERVFMDALDLSKKAASEAIAESGMMASIQPETSTYTLLAFNDGSGFLSMVTDGINQRFQDAWLARMTSIKDIKAEARVGITDAFLGAINGMSNEIPLSALGLNHVNSMVDTMALNLLRNVAARKSLLIPMNDLVGQSLTTILNALSLDGAWRTGVIVMGDGAPIKTPEDLQRMIKPQDVANVDAHTPPVSNAHH